MESGDSSRGLGTQLLHAFEAGLEAANPTAAVRRAFEARPPGPFSAVLAVGKASLGMLDGAAPWLPAEMPGVVVTTAGQAGRRAAIHGVEVFGAGHPVPDAVGEAAAAAVCQLFERRPESLLVLISGGASALLPAPAEGLLLADKIATTEALLASGASIHEVNTVRKHLSRFKGGGLARLAHKAGTKATVLVLSDVPGDDLSVVGSGPSVGDASTFAEARAVLERCVRPESPPIPGRVLEHIGLGCLGEVPETPAPGDSVFGSVETLLVGGNAASVAAAAVQLQGSFRVIREETPIEGEAREVGRQLARRLNSEHLDPEADGCEGDLAFCGGGETTVTIRGRGLGGRNQELALAFALEMEILNFEAEQPTGGEPRDDETEAMDSGRAGALRRRDPANSQPVWAFLSAGTDGRDGPTDASGALVTPATIERGGGVKAARQALQDNDSYRFLDAAGALLQTGETGTNVADLQLFVRQSKGE